MVDEKVKKCKQEIIEMGIQDFMQKPYRIEEFSQKISRLIKS